MSIVIQATTVLAFRNGTLAIERWSPKGNFIVASLRIDVATLCRLGRELADPRRRTDIAIELMDPQSIGVHA